MLFLFVELSTKTFSQTTQFIRLEFLRMQLSPMVTFGPMVQFSMVTFFPMMHGGINLAL